MIRHRIALLAAAVALTAPLAAQGRTRPARDSATVVFVCEHGTVKSALALALFRKIAAERALPVRAISRGTAPDTALPPFMRSGLQQDGLSLGAFTPTRLDASDLASAILVVSFDQPVVTRTVGGKVPLKVWDGLPAVSTDYAVARDSMRVRIGALVDSLARTRR
jgi:hypothetical protein